MPNYAQWANIAQQILQRMLSKNLGFSSFDINHNLNGIQVSFVLQDEMELAPLDLQLRIIRLQKKSIEEIKKILASIKPAEIKFEFRYNGEIIEYQMEMDLQLQEGYFFYPGGRFDFDPILKVMECTKINKFVYCDYDGWIDEIELLREENFELIDEQEIGPEYLNSQLVTWEPYWHPMTLPGIHINSFAKKFKYRYIKENREIEFFYFKTEALGTYKLLCENWGAPAVMRLQDHGGLHIKQGEEELINAIPDCIRGGGHWAQFGGENSMFYNLALEISTFPTYIFKPLDYLIEGIEDGDVLPQIWPGYANYLPIEPFRCGEFDNEFFIRK
jgi:hypothetical protein